MIIKARINGEDGKMYRLCEWNNNDFDNNPTLKLQTDNLAEVKEVFEHISKIEIFQANTLIAEYTLYNKYSSIAYLGTVYVPHENIFADCLQVKLERSSLAEQVQRIEEKINKVYDIDEMTVDEYREFVLNKISEDCTADIKAGEYIDGELFTYDDHDQTNILQLYLIAKMNPDIPMIPYHSSGHGCVFYSATQIEKIYLTLVVRLLRLTTYANQLNMYVRTLQTKDELARVYYGMELPEEYNRTISDIMTVTLEALSIGESNEETTE